MNEMAKTYNKFCKEVENTREIKRCTQIRS